MYSKKAKDDYIEKSKKIRKWNNMIKCTETEQIKGLIKDGFDLELISFELDIPIEEVRQIKVEMEKTKQPKLIKTYSAKEIIEIKNEQAHSRMEQIRKKYEKLFSKSNQVSVQKSKRLSAQEVEQINSVITKMEESIKGMQGLSRKARKQNANQILTELKKLNKYQLTIGQSERLYSLMQSGELEELKMNETDKIDFEISSGRREALKKLIEAVDIAQSETEDLEELKLLNRKISREMEKANPIFVGAVKSRINNKLLKIQQQNIIHKIRNDIPVSVEAIIRDIAQGTLNIQKANAMIDEEAKRRVESRPKAKFALTQEQERKQILIQIRTILEERAEKYCIENPEITIKQMQVLFGGELETAIRVTVKNLIQAKNFEKAKDVCDQFSDKGQEDSIAITIRRLRKEIRNAEISDIVLKGIHMKGTIEDDRRYLELIEKGIKRGNVKLGAISLGKSQDGLRTITLEDIWIDENEKGKFL